MPAAVLLVLVAALGCRTMLRNQDYDSELAIWRETVRTAPDNPRARSFLGEAFFKEGDTARAIAELNQAIRLKSDYDEAYRNRGVMYDNLGDQAQALDDLSRAIKLNPSDLKAYHARAKVYEEQSCWPLALQDLTAMVKLLPKSVPAYISRAEAYERAGQYAEAKRDYDEAIRLDPNPVQMLNARAWLLATCPDAQVRSGEQALTDARRACELTQWKRPDFLDSLAAAFAEQGDFASAIEWERKAIKLGATKKEFARDARQRLELYQAGQPFREKAK
jgi:tetratricopeptide (TPR) repeat protein